MRLKVASNLQAEHCVSQIVLEWMRFLLIILLCNIYVFFFISVSLTLLSLSSDFNRCCFVETSKERDWRASCQIAGWNSYEEVNLLYGWLKEFVFESVGHLKIFGLLLRVLILSIWKQRFWTFEIHCYRCNSFFSLVC